MGQKKYLEILWEQICKLLFRSFWLIILYPQVHYKKSFPGSHFCLNFITFIRLMQCFKFLLHPRVFSHAALLWLRTSQGGRLGSHIHLHFINQKLLQNGNYLNSYSQRNFHEFFFFFFVLLVGTTSIWSYLNSLKTYSLAKSLQILEVWNFSKAWLYTQIYLPRRHVTEREQNIRIHTAAE